MGVPQRVKMVEVGPRDGLQNEATPVPTQVKLELIDRLGSSGLRVIEATSFVAPGRVPQLSDHAELLTGIARRPGVSYPVLVPNLTGLSRALAAGATEIAVFAAASEPFSRRNLNCGIEQSLERYAEVVAKASSRGVRARGYVSCVLGCPFQGEVSPGEVAKVAGRLLELGCYEISLGDTIGVGTPGKARALVAAVTERVPLDRIAVHFHDTYGQALANVLAVLELGVGVVDSSVAGLGGCPFAPGASGNLASEDLLYLLNGLGIETGVDLDLLAAAGNYISAFLNRPSGSKAARALSCRLRS